MRHLPDGVTQEDIATQSAYLTLDAPKPPGNPLGRLIVRSQVDASTEPPDSIRAALANAETRKLARVLANFGAYLQPNVKQALQGRIKRLTLAAR